MSDLKLEVATAERIIQARGDVETIQDVTKDVLLLMSIRICAKQAKSSGPDYPAIDLQKFLREFEGNDRVFKEQGTLSRFCEALEEVITKTLPDLQAEQAANALLNRKASFWKSIAESVVLADIKLCVPLMKAAYQTLATAQPALWVSRLEEDLAKNKFFLKRGIRGGALAELFHGILEFSSFHEVADTIHEKILSDAEWRERHSLQPSIMPEFDIQNDLSRIILDSINLASGNGSAILTLQKFANADGRSEIRGLGLTAKQNAKILEDAIKKITSDGGIESDEINAIIEDLPKIRVFLLEGESENLDAYFSVLEALIIASPKAAENLLGVDPERQEIKKFMELREESLETDRLEVEIGWLYSMALIEHPSFELSPAEIKSLNHGITVNEKIFEAILTASSDQSETSRALAERATSFADSLLDQDLTEYKDILTQKMLIAIIAHASPAKLNVHIGIGTIFSLVSLSPKAIAERLSERVENEVQLARNAHSRFADHDIAALAFSVMQNPKIEFFHRLYELEKTNTTGVYYFLASRTSYGEQTLEILSNQELQNLHDRTKGAFFRILLSALDNEPAAKFFKDPGKGGRLLKNLGFVKGKSDIVPTLDVNGKPKPDIRSSEDRLASASAVLIQKALETVGISNKRSIPELKPYGLVACEDFLMQKIRAAKKSK